MSLTYPLQKEEAGRHAWILLHHNASLYSDTPTEKDKRRMQDFIFESMSSIAKLCANCKKHIYDYLKAHPLEQALADKKSLSKYLCAFHNSVNERNGKDIVNCHLILKEKPACKDCEKEKEKEKEKEVVVVEEVKKDTTPSTLTYSFEKFKEASTNVFNSLCDKYKVPYPLIKFHECPGNPLNSCTSMWIDARTQEITERPTVYLHPNMFGLRSIVHEFFHYIKQLKNDSTSSTMDEHEVEKAAQSLINHEFPYDDIDKADLRPPVISQPTSPIIEVEQIVKKDTQSRLSSFPISERIYNKYLYNVRRRDGPEKETDLFADLMKGNVGAITGDEGYESFVPESESSSASSNKQHNTNSLSFLDGIYSPFAAFFGMKASDLNQSNTPMILSNATMALLKTYLSPIGALLVTTVTSLGIGGALIAARSSLSYGDKIMMNNFGANFLFSAIQYLEPVAKQDIFDGAMELGNAVSMQQWDTIPDILMGDYLATVFGGAGFAGAAAGETSTSQASSQSAIRNQQRAASLSTGGGSNTIKAGNINKRQQTADLRSIQKEYVMDQLAQGQIPGTPENLQAGRPFKSSVRGGNIGSLSRGVPGGSGIGGSSRTGQPTLGPSSVMIPSDIDEAEEQYESSFGMHVADGRTTGAGAYTGAASTYGYYPEAYSASSSGDVTTRRNTIRDVFGQDSYYDNFNDVYYEGDEFYG